MIRFSLLHKYNLFLTTIIFLAFLSFNENYTLLSFILAFFGAISSACILYIVLYLALFGFSFLKKIGLYLASFCFGIVNLILIVDFFIFRLYKFHINGMVLNILTSPDAAESIQLGTPALLALIVFIASIFICEFLLARVLLKKELKELKNKTLNKKVLLSLFIVMLIEKFSFGFASLYSKTEILTPFKTIPLYQPLTFNKFAAKHFGIKTKKESKNHISTSSNLDYPKKQIRLKQNPNKVNIFVIASDSVRYDFINDKISPNIQNFKANSIDFKNHHSGGNATRFGIFSFFYGLNSSYWFSFKAAQKGPVFFDVLKKLGYDINIVSSTNTRWPPFNKTAYVDIKDKVYDNFGKKSDKPWKKDEKSSQKFMQIIDKLDTSKPQFAFLFLDAPHGYSFPKEYEKFKAQDEVNYLSVSKESQNLKHSLNAYKNAIHYNDMLFKKVIDKLKQKGLYENSIIIFTSDHGQEFFEYGFFGHNSSYSKAQTNVPFIVKLPKGKRGKIDKLTSHIDFVPTILSFIGVQNNTKDYSNGYDLFDENFHRDSVFIASWNTNAIKTKEFTYVFTNRPDKMFENEIRKTDSYEELKNHSIDNKLTIKAIKENSHFYK